MEGKNADSLMFYGYAIRLLAWIGRRYNFQTNCLLAPRNGVHPKKSLSELARRGIEYTLSVYSMAAPRDYAPFCTNAGAAARLQLSFDV
jgi:hypothetical protein